MEGEKISPSNRKAVELVLLIEAGTYVRGLNPMRKPQMGDMILKKYQRLIARLLITAVILRITVKYCFWLVRDSNHPFLFLSNCIQNPLGLCSVSVWSYVESYVGIISSITVQNKGILEESQES